MRNVRAVAESKRDLHGQPVPQSPLRARFPGNPARDTRCLESKWRMPAHLKPSPPGPAKSLPGNLPVGGYRRQRSQVSWCALSAPPSTSSARRPHPLPQIKHPWGAGNSQDGHGSAGRGDPAPRGVVLALPPVTWNCRSRGGKVEVQRQGSAVVRGRIELSEGQYRFGHETTEAPVRIAGIRPRQPGEVTR